MTRPRDNKGRLVPKFGVAKWGNDYWGYGVSYQDWKYRHPASVRVFAEGYGVDLKGLTSAQKDWLKMRYEEDVDSKTALFALIDEFNLRSRRAESFHAESDKGHWRWVVGEGYSGRAKCKVCGETILKGQPTVDYHSTGGILSIHSRPEDCAVKRAESFSVEGGRETATKEVMAHYGDEGWEDDEYEEVIERRLDGYCIECSEPFHDYCGMVSRDEGCSCCDNTRDSLNEHGMDAESFSGEWIGEKPFQEYLPDKKDVKVVALTGLIVGWFINNQLLRKK